jgi:hypothetical protein
LYIAAVLAGVPAAIDWWHGNVVGASRSTLLAGALALIAATRSRPGRRAAIAIGLLLGGSLALSVYHWVG